MQGCIHTPASKKQCMFASCAVARQWCTVWSAMLLYSAGTCGYTFSCLLTAHQQGLLQTPISVVGFGWACADELMQFLNLPGDQLPVQQRQQYKQYKRTWLVRLGCAVHTTVACTTTHAHWLNIRCTTAADMLLLWLQKQFAADVDSE
jgi:hypothetical protein